MAPGHLDDPIFAAPAFRRDRVFAQGVAGFFHVSNPVKFGHAAPAAIRAYAGHQIGRYLDTALQAPIRVVCGGFRGVDPGSVVFPVNFRLFRGVHGWVVLDTLYKVSSVRIANSYLVPVVLPKREPPSAG